MWISIEYISRVKVFDRNLFPAVQASYMHHNRRGYQAPKESGPKKMSALPTVWAWACAQLTGYPKLDIRYSVSPESCPAPNLRTGILWVRDWIVTCFTTTSLIDLWLYVIFPVSRSVIFSFSHIFNNVTLDFNSFTVIAVFKAVLTSFD
jgi:hypothetical protein